MSGISGVLIELAAIGNQDSYLNIRPRLTLFRGSYRRITNFAWCPIEQDFSNAVNFETQTSTALPRAGDLVAQMYLRMVLPRLPFTNAGAGANTALVNANSSYCNGAGYAAVNDVELSIGGYPFDKQSGMYMFLWNQLSHKPGAQEKITCLQGDWRDIALALTGANLSGWSANQAAGTTSEFLNIAATGQPLYVPMAFWFNRYYAQALPMIALQYHEVKLTVDFNSLVNITCPPVAVAAPPADVVVPAFSTAANSAFKCNLQINYVFLDTVERRLFAATPHEYLIDQVHMPDGRNGLNVSNTSINYQPVVNHPVKEFIWAFKLPLPATAAGSNPDLPAAYVNSMVGQNFDLHGTVNRRLAAGAVGFAPFGQNSQTPLSLVNGINNADSYGWDSFTTAQLMLNGNERLQARNPTYFREVVPREVHSSVPSLSGNACGFQVYNYSFAVDPEDWKPSGSCNFSRIDTVTMKFEGLTSNSTLYFFYRNFNVMKIVAGMAGLRYAN